MSSETYIEDSRISAVFTITLWKEVCNRILSDLNFFANYSCESRRSGYHSQTNTVNSDNIRGLLDDGNINEELFSKV